jgi:hypothetical protein
MKNIKTEINWAVIYTLVGLIWIAIERIVGLHSTHIDKHLFYTNIFMLPAILVYILALRDKRKRDFGGHITFKQAFASGLRLTLIIAILSPVGQVISNSIISPQFFPNMISYVVQRGSMNFEDAVQYFSLKNYVIQAIFGSGVVGILTSALGALLVRNTKEVA